MAQDTTWTGAVLTESDINAKLMHEDNAWTSYTPTLTQSGAVTKTVTYAKYGRAGRFIYGNIRLDVTGAGTASNAVTISLPATAASSSAVVGSGYIYDSSAAIAYTGMVAMATTTTFVLYPTGGALSPLGALVFTAALASGDIVNISFHYEAVS